MQDISSSIIKLSGSDRRQLLQGIITNDIAKLSSDHPLYACMLNPKGKYLFDFYLLEVEDQIWLSVTSSQAKALLKKLKLYKLKSDVQLELAEDLKVIHDYEPINEAKSSFKDPRYEQLGYINIITTSSQLPKQQDNSYLQLKYDMAVIDGSYELDQETSFIMQFGLDYLHAISFNKGCYVGQEVISRTYHQGVIRKAIYKAEAKENLSSYLKANILQDSKNIGWLCSAWQEKAICQIRQDRFNPESPAYIENGPYIYLTKAPWYSN